MKLSTMVKEYIKDKINEKYPLRVEPNGKIDKILEELDERIKAETKDIMTKITKAFNDRLAVRVYRNGKYVFEDFEIRSFKADYAGAIRSKETAEILQYNEEIKAKREKVYRDIIVSMELGGTKAELEEMLKNLPD